MSYGGNCTFVGGRAPLSRPRTRRLKDVLQQAIRQSLRQGTEILRCSISSTVLGSNTARGGQIAAEKHSVISRRGLRILPFSPNVFRTV